MRVADLVIIDVFGGENWVFLFELMNVTMNSNVLCISGIPCDEPLLQQLVGAYVLNSVFPFG